MGYIIAYPTPLCQPLGEFIWYREKTVHNEKRARLWHLHGLVYARAR
jgi:hypothetical protein